MSALRYGSVCSGIEAASVAWHPLGWLPQWFAEIEKFPSKVLACRWPAVPNLGDFTAIGVSNAPPGEPIDLLVGGTPCQSFSVAGLRGGLADDRGNLALEFLRLAQRTRAEWLVWENVPGVFSSLSHHAPDPRPPPDPLDLELDGQEVDVADEYDSEELHAFNCFLAGLRECGYGFAYRVFDAQYFGLAQRRKRVFVVARLGDWRGPAAVLFERAGLRGDPSPSREAWQEVAGPLGGSASGSGWRGDLDSNGAYIPAVSPALKARDCKGPSSDGDGDGDGAPLVTHSLRGEGFDASEDGTGRGTPLVAVPLLEVGARCGEADEREGLGIGKAGDPMFTLQASKQHGVLAFDTTQLTHPENRSNPQIGDPCHQLSAHAHVPAIAFQHRASVSQSMNPGEVSPSLGALNAEGLSTMQAGGVRCLMPVECERLQGFDDGYTDIPGAADGPRYRALGNSMAVSVMAWIGRRIELVRALLEREAA